MKDLISPETEKLLKDKFFLEWKQKNQNHKLDQPKTLVQNVKSVVKNIITQHYTKENV